jgi:putative MATE family efflux protein
VPHHPNLTEGPITRTLLLFALPVLGANALQSLNGAVNQFWVGHTLGVTAITAIGNANIVTMLLLAAVIGVSMASNVLIAQAYGAGDYDEVKTVMGTAITFFFVMSITVAGVGFFAAPTILGLMGTPPDARAEAEIYLRIVFLAMPSMYFFNFLQMVQRGVGDSKTPFYFMALAVVLDMILNPLLIRGIGPFPRLGIAGSAMSTFIGQGVSLLCLIGVLYARHSMLALKGAELKLLKPNLTILRALVGRGLPMSLQMLVMSGAAMVMIGFVNGYGAVTSAAFVAASQVWTYLQMPGMALGVSVMAMAAQNVGAQRWDRVDKLARSAVICGMIISVVVASLIFATGNLSFRAFLPLGSPALPVAMHINNLAIWSAVLFSLTFSLSGVVRATGAVWPPLLIMVASMYVVRIPFAAFLAPYLGADSIWLSFPVGAIVSGTLMSLYYLKGNWRRAQMIVPVSPHMEAADGGQAAPAVAVVETGPA